MVLDGTYPPGSKLRMHQLRDDLGAGLSPIREALFQLSATGLIEFEDNKGFRVANVTRKDVQDLHVTYATIESLALQQAIKKGDSEWEANIAGKLYLLNKIEKSKNPITWDKWYPANQAFHRALVEGCDSKSLLELRDGLVLRLERYWRRSFNRSGALAIAADDHTELAKYALERDAASACKILSKHILGSLDEFIQSLELSEE